MRRCPLVGAASLSGDVLVGCGRYLRFRFEAGGGHDLEVFGAGVRDRESGRGRDDAGRLYLPQIRSVSVGDVMRVDGFCCYAVDRVGYTHRAGSASSARRLPVGQIIRGQPVSDQMVGAPHHSAKLTGMRAQGGL